MWVGCDGLRWSRPPASKASPRCSRTRPTTSERILRCCVKLSRAGAASAAPPARDFDGAAIVGGADDPTGRPGERAVPGAVWLAIGGLARYRLTADDRSRTIATEAGEEVHVLDRALHPEFDDVRDDFVVFDEASVLWYRYTPEDVLTGYDYTEEPDVVRRCVALAEEVRAAAVPYRDFMARIR